MRRDFGFFGHLLENILLTSTQKFLKKKSNTEIQRYRGTEIKKTLFLRVSVLKIDTHSLSCRA